MTIQDEVLAIERGFWTGGANFYRQNLDDVCVTVFTEMAGAFKRDEIAGMITDTDRWRDLNLGIKGFLEPAPGFAILTYAVKATEEQRFIRGRGNQRLHNAQRRVEDGASPADAASRKASEGRAAIAERVKRCRPVR